ncbi:hypothetical protein SOPP22_14940 [Shewanella sp. OPT22]|nr:hypothetical protein SOPP22_14940 [Shewanella sp. OPT22]
MNLLSKIIHFCDSFYPRLYEKSKPLCFCIAFFQSLLIVMAIHYFWFDSIDFSTLILAAVIAYLITIQAPKSLKEREQFQSKLSEYGAKQPSKHTAKINLVKFLILTIVAGIGIDLIDSHLRTIGYDTDIIGYKLIYLLGYALLIPMFVAVVNWEHVGKVYERYATRDQVQGLPWFYHFGVGASIAYATSSDASGILLALLLSFGTAYHVYYSIPPVRKETRV